MSFLSSLVTIKHQLDEFLYLFFYLRRKIRKHLFPLTLLDSNPLPLVIMCVKRPSYVGLSIRNINSLHYFNCHHQVTLYSDSLCALEFESQRRYLDYPDRVSLHVESIPESTPWQFSKVEAILFASNHKAALIDADTIWHTSPTLDIKKPTFLVKAYQFHTQKAEWQEVKYCLKLKDNSRLTHYVTGFVYLPSKLINQKLKQNLRNTVRALFASSDPRIRRLAEEISVSVTVGLHYKGKINTLKRKDGPHDKEVMTSIYYGCTHNYLE